MISLPQTSNLLMRFWRGIQFLPKTKGHGELLKTFNAMKSCPGKTGETIIKFALMLDLSEFFRRFFLLELALTNNFFRRSSQGAHNFGAC